MTDYHELADRAERGDLVVTGSVLHGSAATSFAQQSLMDATGTDSIEDAVAAALA